VTNEAIKENGVTNFLPAQGGIDAETIEEVRQRAQLYEFIFFH